MRRITLVLRVNFDTDCFRFVGNHSGELSKTPLVQLLIDFGSIVYRLSYVLEVTYHNRLHFLSFTGRDKPRRDFVSNVTDEGSQVVKRSVFRTLEFLPTPASPVTP